VSKKIIISKEKLQRLYWDERKSSIEIGKLFHCHPMTIRNRIHELGIVKRSPSDARMRYGKQDFSGNSLEKAYLLGFRLGDLNVYRTNSTSDLIVVRCHTTQNVQVKLMKQLLVPYGQVTVSKGIYGYNINCYLNKTFSFLLPKHKKAPNYIRNNEVRSWVFIAGYVDAEGYFALNQSKARFKIDSYDVQILDWMRKILQQYSMHVIFRQIAKRGQPQYRTGIFHKDLWRFEINEARSILRFIHTVGPYIRHEKRKADMIICQHNVEDRVNKGTVV
jgi:hypothetical protein